MPRNTYEGLTAQEKFQRHQKDAVILSIQKFINKSHSAKGPAKAVEAVQKRMDNLEEAISQITAWPVSNSNDSLGIPKKEMEILVHVTNDIIYAGENADVALKLLDRGLSSLREEAADRDEMISSIVYNDETVSDYILNQMMQRSL